MLHKYYIILYELILHHCSDELKNKFYFFVDILLGLYYTVT